MQLRTMTVKELIESLEDYPPESKVVFSHDYGDHCHTMAAGLIDTVVTGNLVETAYSDSRLAVGDDELEPAHRNVVIISSR